MNFSALLKSAVRIDSECFVPYLLMCAIASSMFSTILIAIIRSRYSVPQSSSTAGFRLGRSCMVFSQALTSTPFRFSAETILGMNCLATFLWTISFSSALHVPGLWHLALMIMSMARVRSASSST